MRKIWMLLLVALSGNSFAQKHLNVSLAVNYAPNNYTTGSGFFVGEQKIVSISQSPILHLGIDYVQFRSESLSFGFGLEYSYVRAQSNDFDIPGIGTTPYITVSSNDIAVRNYLLPNVSATWHLPVTRKTKLLFGLRAKLGMPFLSYDRIETPTIHPLYGFIKNLSENEKIPKYTGDDLGEDFSDGLVFGGEFSCLYSFFLKKNQSGRKIQMGPNINVFKLNSADDIKYSFGIRVLYDHVFFRT